MKRALYIGVADKGSTAYMRYITLKNILRGSHNIDLIDTSQGFGKNSRVVNSIGFRYKYGPLISIINNQVKDNIQSNYYDFVWIDKANLIEPLTVEKLRQKSRVLIHFTPDPAFLYNKSLLFKRSIAYFDYCITTKTYELHQYKIQKAKGLLLCTQGYDAEVHYPRHNEIEKTGIVFIGRYETNRRHLIEALLKEDITIKLGGPKWNKFAKRHAHNKNLIYYGDSITGDKYATIISSAKIGLGLLSKCIPEKHTTRTFEIPACRTVLATERNDETADFFTEDEALFYSSEKELISKIKTLLEKDVYLNKMAQKGYEKATSQGYDYKSILSTVLEKIAIR